MDTFSFEFGFACGMIAMTVAAHGVWFLIDALYGEDDKNRQWDVLGDFSEGEKNRIMSK